ncbi:MAG: single-stranded-DNA-specific exonuclease RecJ, partial [Clostridium sp.]|nr:single-stranded-DNA-specific exonuclease RecJ [Clostridium sp.]
MRKKWLIKNIKYDYKGLSQELGVPEEISRCIINRCPGTLEEIKDYLNPSLKSLYDPSLMKDLDLAVELIMEAIDSEEHIRLMGDFDIDGSMRIYVAYMALKKIGANVSYDIPDRVTEGYGLNEAMVEKAADEGVGLIITFDNGISAFDAVNHAKELGLMVIVTDHHDVPFKIEEDKRIETIPLADAVVNPKREECNYPFKMLCGAG